MPAVISFLDDGKIEVRIRIKRTINGKPTLVVNQRKYITEIPIKESDWNHFNGLKTQNARDGFLHKNPEFGENYSKLEEIRVKINECGENLNAETMSKIIHDVIYAKQIEAEEKRREKAAARKAAKEEAKRKAEAMTLTKFIDVYVDSIKDGTKTTIQNGRKYSRGSKFNTANALGHFKEFMEDTGVTYDFEDVDIDCYNRYKAWLMSRDISKVGFKRGIKKLAPEGEVLHYSDGTIGRFIKQLKAMLRAADARGYKVNPAYKSAEFKGQVIDIDSIYLTRKDLEAMENADLSRYKPESSADCNIELARDIFMVGVWTAQRVSDYNNIGKQNIKEYDVDGRKKYFVAMHQQKTGRYVEIPCNSKLMAILEKYPEGMPRLSDEWINKYVKEIGKLAKLDEMIEVNESRGGEIVRLYYPKYQLICTHTARRTGATLMYLAGIPIYDIMKVTGHRSVATLEKYIRADKLEVAQKLARTYDYFE